MNVWESTAWKKIYDFQHRSGAWLKIDKEVDPEVKRACKEFMRWLRRYYFFPVRVPIYVKSTYRIRARDGELVVGICSVPFDHREEPYIRIATGDYEELEAQRGQDDALAPILKVIAHELTHYFQWINDIVLTEIGTERQAQRYADYILDGYAAVRDHP